jgi:RES domain-containing protein
MRAFRIVKRRHAPEAFTGEGARIHGGRWNRAGTPMVYAAQSRALAALESLAHFGGAERRIAFVIYEIEIPDALVLWIDPESLPAGWRADEPAAITQDLGTAWQREGHSVALAVPSVLIPEETCVLLNPDHADTGKVAVSFPVAFEFDERL